MGGQAEISLPRLHKISLCCLWKGREIWQSEKTESRVFGVLNCDTTAFYFWSLSMIISLMKGNMGELRVDGVGQAIKKHLPSKS